MRITPSTAAASARGRALRYTRANKAPPASALQGRGSPRLCTTLPFTRGPNRDTLTGKRPDRWHGRGDLGKLSEIRTRGADGGVRYALRGWRPQAKAAHA